jgi:hypothetical protein
MLLTPSKLTVFNLEMKWVWSMLIQHGKPDLYLVASLENKPIDLSCPRGKMGVQIALSEWKRDLSTPLGPDGIRDTAISSCTWEYHREREARKAEAQYLALHDLLGKRIGEFNCPKARRELNAIRERHRSAKITPLYLKGAIEFYIHGDLETMRKHPTREGQKRRIADDVHGFFVMADQLNLDDEARRMPGLEEMDVKQAWAVLNRLRRSCMEMIDKSGENQKEEKPTPNLSGPIQLKSFLGIINISYKVYSGRKDTVWTDYGLRKFGHDGMYVRVDKDKLSVEERNLVAALPQRTRKTVKK